jgi:hypothetical protein
VVGTEYELSFDFKVGVANIAVTESCTIYLYHDSLSTSNVVRQTTGSFSLSTNDRWQTLAGKYTATSDSAVFGFYATCSPYRIPQISIYVDNAYMRGKNDLSTVEPISVCYMEP